MFVSMILLLILSFFAAIAWAPAFIGFLRNLKMGKQIRVDGPQSHMAKAGTPTMGGWLIIATSVILSVIFIHDLAVLIPIIAALLAFGLFGTIDDFANLRSKQGLGLKVKPKFVLHTLIALGISLLLYPVFGFDTVIVPGIGTYHIGWWLVPLSTFVIFSMTSGVNEIDGLDGLAGGTTAVAFVAFAALAVAAGNSSLATITAIIIGSILAFLWYNVHPARFFMGDTGSLALGASLAVVAIMSGWVLLLPIIGLMFVIELVSVILQVSYFKYTKGKRLFKMSPFHHHLELSGWPETQVVQRFWLMAAISSAMALVIATLS